MQPKGLFTNAGDAFGLERMANFANFLRRREELELKPLENLTIHQSSGAVALPYELFNDLTIGKMDVRDEEEIDMEFRLLFLRGSSALPVTRLASVSYGLDSPVCDPSVDLQTGIASSTYPGGAKAAEIGSSRGAIWSTGTRSNARERRGHPHGRGRDERWLGAIDEIRQEEANREEMDRQETRLQQRNVQSKSPSSRIASDVNLIATQPTKKEEDSDGRLAARRERLT
ncbi:hypothetical protein BKA70DRAFT_1236350 [Coprinopsis sp. MPI-PUGE-AT-0042]|nr:hypothetical protein BKA70DRAFT_1236350 [Coprinopsis sp. MPI-PUGE-AT-0042]